MTYAARTGGDGAAASVIHADSSHPDFINVPDTELMFLGTYARSGPDLVLTGQDGRHHIIPGYFAAEHRQALVAPNGATLSGDTVFLLAGSAAPAQYAQAQPAAAAADAIGQVAKVFGQVTVVRNGTTVALNVGDAVYRSDVVQTGGSSSVGITFPDGTALNLVAYTRMALNEYSYDPNGTTNNALLTLVEGTFAFVAGKVAHTGTMKIGTPVATMGIRGTTGYVEQMPATTVTANAAQNAYAFAVVNDFGVGSSGVYDLYDPITGIVLATVARPGFLTYLTPQGLGTAPAVSVEAMTNSQFALEQVLVQGVFQALNLLTLPGTTNGGNGSSTPPNDLNQTFPQLNNDNNTNTPQLINYPTGGGGPGGGPTGPTNPPPNGPPGNPTGPTGVVEWIAATGGNWNGAGNWSDGIPPDAVSAVEILTAVTVTVTGAVAANGLTLVAGATLDIESGASLTIANSIQGPGTVDLDSSGSDPTLAIDGAVTLQGGGTIEMTGGSGDNIIGVSGSHAQLTNVSDTITGAGTIGSGDGRLTLINDATIEASGGVLAIATGNTVTNNAGAVLQALDGGTLEIEDNVSNSGTITALAGGIVQLESITVSNSATGLVDVLSGGTLDLDGSAIIGGTIESYGTVNVTGSSTLNGDSVINDGMIGVGAGASLLLEGGTVTNQGGGVIDADGGSVTIEVTGGVTNDGLIEATDGGTVTLDVIATGGVNDGTIAADGGTVIINGEDGGGGGGTHSGGNFGTIKAIDGGTLTLNGGITNGVGATLEVDGTGSQFNMSDGMTENAGTILAENYGVMTLASILLTNDAGATVEATQHGTIDYETGGLTNYGTFKADNDGTITFSGEIGITNEAGGLIEATSGGSITFETSGIGSVSNDGGTIEAIDGGTITFDSSLNGIQNDDGGTIESGANSTVTIEAVSVMNNGGIIEANGTNAVVNLEGATINGGTLETSDGGIIEAPVGTNTFNGVTIADGTFIETSDGNTIVLENTTTIDGTVTLEGGGTVSMDVSSYDIVAGAVGATLVNETKIVGDGTIGNGNGELTLHNESIGRIDADLAGDTLTINTGNAVANEGTLEATNGATLAIDDAVNNDGGTIEATGAGSTVAIGESLYALNSGTIEAEAGGTITINVTAGADNDSGGLIEATGAGSTITINAGAGGDNEAGATIEAVAGGSVTFTGGISNGGAITAHGGTVTLSGGGVTNESGGTIKAVDGGTVSITVSVVDDLTNDCGGMIEASGTGSTLTITGQIENSGTIEAISGGSVTINDAETDSTNYNLIDAARGGTVTLNTGNNTNHGTIEADGGTLIMNLADGETNPAHGNFGTIQAIDGGSVTVNGNPGNDGTFAATGAGSTLEFTGGTVSNSIMAAGTIEATSNGAVTFDADSTIYNGAGTAGVSGGTIAATTDGTITFDAGSAIYNGSAISGGGGMIEASCGGTVTFDDDAIYNGSTSASGGGMIEASRGGTVDLDGSTVHNGNGTIEACGADAKVLLDGATIMGGTLETSACGLIETGAGASTLSNLRIMSGSELQVDAGTSLTLENTITNDGTITLVAAQDPSLVISGNVTLAGTGTVVLNGCGDAIVGATEGANTLNNHDTIEGAGNIGAGGNSLTLVNASCGVIDANAAHETLVVNTGDNTVVNDGTMEASCGGKLEIDSNLCNSNSVHADNGAVTFGAVCVDNGGDINASDGGCITFCDTTVNNDHDGSGIEAYAGSSVTFNGSTIDNEGGTIGGDGGVVTLSDCTIDNCGGTLEANGDSANGELDITGNTTISGNGTIELTNNGLVLIQDTNTICQNVTFSGGCAGTLQLDYPSDFKGTITGFCGSGDVLDLKGFDACAKISANYNSDTDKTTVCVKEGDSVVTLTFNGDYSACDFTIKSDGNGGIDISYVTGKGGSGDGDSHASGGPVAKSSVTPTSIPVSSAAPAPVGEAASQPVSQSNVVAQSASPSGAASTVAPVNQTVSRSNVVAQTGSQGSAGSTVESVKAVASINAAAGVHDGTSAIWNAVVGSALLELGSSAAVHAGPVPVAPATPVFFGDGGIGHLQPASGLVPHVGSPPVVPVSLGTASSAPFGVAPGLATHAVTAPVAPVLSVAAADDHATVQPVVNVAATGQPGLALGTNAPPVAVHATFADDGATGVWNGIAGQVHSVVAPEHGVENTLSSKFDPIALGQVGVGTTGEAAAHLGVNAPPLITAHALLADAGASDVWNGVAGKVDSILAPSSNVENTLSPKFDPIALGQVGVGTGEPGPHLGVNAPPLLAAHALLADAGASDVWNGIAGKVDSVLAPSSNVQNTLSPKFDPIAVGQVGVGTSGEAGALLGGNAPPLVAHVPLADAGAPDVWNGMAGKVDPVTQPANGVNNTLVLDPSGAAHVGLGGDSFVFEQNLGVELGQNHNPEPVAFEHVEHVQAVQQLASLFAPDIHAEPMLDHSQHEAITPPGMSATEVHAALQSIVHLH